MRRRVVLYSVTASTSASLARSLFFGAASTAQSRGLAWLTLRSAPTSLASIFFPGKLGFLPNRIWAGNRLSNVRNLRQGSHFPLYLVSRVVL